MLTNHSSGNLILSNTLHPLSSWNVKQLSSFQCSFWSFINRLTLAILATTLSLCRRYEENLTTVC